jgi:iron complex transport system substrate-binding protein
MNKKILALVLALALAACMLTGCANQETAETVGTASSASESEAASAESTASQPEENAAEEELGLVETLYAPNFSIERLENGIKRVIDAEGRELILVPRELEEVPAEYADSLVIRTPVERAVLLSTTQVCAFRALGDPDLIDRIAGVTSDADSWSDIPEIQNAMLDGKITYLGAASSLDYELLQSLEPDVVFTLTGSSPQTEQIEKMEELGIPYAVDNEYMEDNYMARMEWMRFLMTFFDADERVDEIMLNAKAAIDAIKEEVSGLDAPKIAIFSVSSGKVYTTLENSWLGSMIADLGAENAFAGLDSKTITEEEAFACVQDADIIIYSSTTTYTNGMEGIQDKFPLISECKAYEEGRVYQYDAIFYHGIDQSDVMAGDLAALLYPQTFADRAISYFVHAE